MRPIDKPGPPNPWPSKNALTFGGANRQAMQNCLGSYTNVPLGNCLGLWLDQVKGTAVGPPCAASRKTAVSAIRNQVGDLYKQASVPLTQELGAFCSFCGTPLSGLLEVEHCVPKAQYPTYSVSWENFVLACGPCNNAKGDTPDRATVRGWLKKANPTETEYYDEIRVGKRYVWADLNSEAYNYLPVGLEYEGTGGAGIALPMPYAANLNNQILSVDIATRVVQARIYEPDNSAYHDVKVRVVVNAVDPVGSTAATDTVALCSFNHVVNPSSTYDRRMLNRTQAWFTCLKALKRLSQASSQDAFDLLWEALVQHSAAAGFYSVWLALINFHSSNLGKEFVKATNVPGLFPNTDTTNLP